MDDTPASLLGQPSCAARGNEALMEIPWGNGWIMVWQSEI
jgi:hypothetical protein